VGDPYFPPGSPQRAAQDHQRLIAWYRSFIRSERAQAKAVLMLLSERGEIDPIAEAGLLYMVRGAWGEDPRLVRAYEQLWFDFVRRPCSGPIEDTLLEFYRLFGQLLPAAAGGAP
jgi:hypothetical protein